MHTDAPAGPSGRGTRLRAGWGQYRWRLVTAVAVSQTVSYGVLYYSFSVFLAPTAQALHASTTAVTGAMTLALIAGAASMLPVGRWLDRHGGRMLMTAGAIVATLLALAWSQVRSVPELYAVWAGIGAVSSAVQYEAAFPVVVSHFPAHLRSRALLGVTVVAGFASSIFLPVAGLLDQGLGWRDAILVLALVHGVVVIPLNAYVRRPGTHAARHHADRTRRETVRRALRDRVFHLLGAGFVAQTGAVATISVLLVTVLRALGHPPAFAAAVAGLLGVLSVTGRLASTAVGQRVSTRQVTVVVFAVQGAGAVLLPLIGRSPLGAMVCVLLFGLGFGVASIARPALLAEHFGTDAFATLSALWAVPLTLMEAFTPLAVALLWHAAGLAWAMAGAAGLCALGSLALLAAGRVRVHDHARGSVIPA
ncbi:MFS transporter [Actinospica sp. MGRD01-02]|uniref:MFS transporter n=1 Tax=Actinospica acidithermotolerans TaxID=2828514 RepID=A0A941IHM6_9ACTN|nr:MFS transporter [Actinospica acidithermotolerans]MBR7828705.1 MFS transporter [Actinospica acidithermotolerans]